MATIKPKEHLKNIGKRLKKNNLKINANTIYDVSRETLKGWYNELFY